MKRPHAAPAGDPIGAVTRGLVLALTCALAVLSARPTSASAQDVGVAGAITGHVVIADGDLGGGAMVDVWARWAWLRVGGFLGVSSVSSSRDSHNRIAMPVGVSVALVAVTGPVELQLRVRGGMWGGATQEVKLTAGGFIGGGPYVMFDLGGGVSLGAGIEVWGILGVGETWAVAPGLSLAWGAPTPDPALETEAEVEVEGDVVP
jgi:hypothetical protein